MRMLSKIRAFLQERHGNAGIMFALSALPVFALTGSVIDYAFLQEQRTRLQNAADAAVLAAMHKYHATDEEIAREIEQYVRSNFREGARVKVDFQSMQVTVERNGDLVTKVGMSLDMNVKTAFVRLLGFDVWRASIRAEASHELGGLEVVMVLDTTGSMQDNEKIDELKLAATDLVDIFEDLADKPQMFRLKVGLVPYTVYVNVGTDKAGEPWLDMGNCCGETPWNGYVGQRPEPYDIADDEDYDKVPVPAVPHFVKDVAHDDPWQNQYSSLREIVPLLDVSDPDNVQTLKDTINGLEAFSWTYIPAGLVWGLRVLSPHEPYTGGMDFDEAAELNVKKVIILMTDGWNTCENANEPINGFWGVRICGVPRWTANKRTLQLCDRIKEKGILIMSVAYDITDQNVRDLMRQCSNYGYYEPMAGELRETFRNIARRLTRLHLSQ